MEIFAQAQSITLISTIEYYQLNIIALAEHLIFRMANLYIKEENKKYQNSYRK